MNLFTSVNSHEIWLFQTLEINLLLFTLLNGGYLH